MFEEDIDFERFKILTVSTTVMSISIVLYVISVEFIIPFIVFVSSKISKYVYIKLKYFFNREFKILSKFLGYVSTFFLIYSFYFLVKKQIVKNHMEESFSLIIRIIVAVIFILWLLYQIFLNFISSLSFRNPKKDLKEINTLATFNSQFLFLFGSLLSYILTLITAKSHEIPSDIKLPLKLIIPSLISFFTYSIFYKNYSKVLFWQNIPLYIFWFRICTKHLSNDDLSYAVHLFQFIILNIHQISILICTIFANTFAFKEVEHVTYIVKQKFIRLFFE